jgi:MFS family permease
LGLGRVRLRRSGLRSQLDGRLLSLRRAHRGEAGGYTALYFSLRAVASAIAVPVAGWTIEVSGSYRSLFLLSGTATLSALVPLAFAPSPQTAAESATEPG